MTKEEQIKEELLNMETDELLEDYDNDDDGEGVVFYRGESGYAYNTWRYKKEGGIKWKAQRIFM